MRPTYRVYVDFDGTISLDDTTDQLLERFADRRWRDVEDEWASGRIGSAECLRRQIELLRMTPAALEDFIDSVEIDDAFPAFIARMKLAGMPIAVVSDDLDLVVEGVLRRAGLQLPVFANHLAPKSADGWRLQFPYSDRSCEAKAGHCKCRSIGIDDAGAILVGDGRSDFCAAGSADYVFAKAALAERCRTQGLPFEAFSTFADLTGRFQGFLERRGWPVLTPPARTASANLRRASGAFPS